MKDIRLIIFDFDGTLGDTRHNIVLTLQETMRQAGLPVREESACAATIGLTLEDGFATLFPELSAEAVAACAASYRIIFEKNRKRMAPQAFPGVRETLSELHGRGIRMSIASSRSSRSLYELMEEMGLEGYIDYFVGAHDVTHPKPDPEPVLKTLKALDVHPENALVVGDMPVDILMGSNAGTHTCGVTYGNATRAQLSAAGAEVLIDSIAELPGLL